MDWIRRNWPDLLIGVALVLVIGMIIATLLTGGSLLSLVRRDTPPEPQTATTIGPETVNDPTAATTADEDAADEASTGTTGTGAGASATAEGDADETAGEGASTGATADIDPFIPGVGDAQTGGGPLLAEGDGSGEEDSAAEEAGVAEEITAETTAGTTAADTETETGADTSSPLGPQAPLPAASPEGSYRVAAGAVGSQEGADALAQGYRDEGHTVEVEQQGDLFLLWAGPYDTEEDAERAAQSIRDAGGDALVYSFSGGADESAADTAEEGAAEASGAPAVETAETAETEGAAEAEAASESLTTTVTEVVTETTPAETAAETATGTDDAEPDVAEPDAAETDVAEPDVAETDDADTETDTEAAAATELGGTASSASGAASALEAAPVPTTSVLPGTPAGQRYLQVGAFASSTSAEPLHQRLEGLGFEVTRSETDTGLTRLYVGPFEGAELSQTQATLTAQGIESFPVTQ